MNSLLTQIRAVKTNQVQALLDPLLHVVVALAPMPCPIIIEWERVD